MASHRKSRKPSVTPHHFVGDECQYCGVPPQVEQESEQIESTGAASESSGLPEASMTGTPKPSLQTTPPSEMSPAEWEYLRLLRIDREGRLPLEPRIRLWREFVRAYEAAPASLKDAPDRLRELEADLAFQQVLVELTQFADDLELQKQKADAFAKVWPGTSAANKAILLSQKTKRIAELNNLDIFRENAIPTKEQLNLCRRFVLSHSKTEEAERVSRVLQELCEKEYRVLCKDFEAFTLSPLDKSMNFREFTERWPGNIYTSHLDAMQKEVAPIVDMKMLPELPDKEWPSKTTINAWMGFVSRHNHTKYASITNDRMNKCFQKGLDALKATPADSCDSITMRIETCKQYQDLWDYNKEYYTLVDKHISHLKEIHKIFHIAHCETEESYENHGHFYVVMALIIAVIAGIDSRSFVTFVLVYIGILITLWIGFLCASISLFATKCKDIDRFELFFLFPLCTLRATLIVGFALLVLVVAIILIAGAIIF